MGTPHSATRATLYDWHNAHLLRGQRADCAYFARAGLRIGKRVLVGGCGTGRVAAVLCAHGYLVTGVDSDAGRLARGAHTYPSLNLVNADLRTFRVAKPFDLTILPYSTAQLFAPGSALYDLAATAMACTSGCVVVDISDNFALRTSCNWHCVLKGPCEDLSSDVTELQKCEVYADHCRLLSRFVLGRAHAIETEERWYFHPHAALVSVFAGAGLKCAKMERGYGPENSHHRRIYHFTALGKSRQVGY